MIIWPQGRKTAFITADREDKANLCRKLEICIDPLNPGEQSSELANGVTGRGAIKEVNVDGAVRIGKKQMEEYQRLWSQGLHNTLSKKVTTIAVDKKHVKIGSDCFLKRFISSINW